MRLIINLIINNTCIMSSQLFNKLNYEFNNSLRNYDMFTSYRFKNVYINLHKDYNRSDTLYVRVRGGYIPCKNCGIRDHSRNMTTYIYYPHPKYYKYNKKNLRLNSIGYRKMI